MDRNEGNVENRQLRPDIVNPHTSGTPPPPIIVPPSITEPHQVDAGPMTHSLAGQRPHTNTRQSLPIPTLHSVPTIPGRMESYGHGQSSMSDQTYSNSSAEEQGSTTGLLPGSTDVKRTQSRSPADPGIDPQKIVMPRVIEPVMLRPPGMPYGRRPRDGYLGDDEIRDLHRKESGTYPTSGEDVDRSRTEKTPITAELTVRQRLEATQKHAEVELQTYQQRARKSGWSVNAAIGAQILFGALTTGISAATTGRQSSIATSILGGLSTMAASYLAKARGSGEPEASRARSKELEHFGRDIGGFLLDHGNAVGSVFDEHIARYRRRFEEIMGNDRSDRIGDSSSASTEKKKHDSPV